MPDIIVRKSKIQGKGVFALRDFKKGEVVIKWDISKQLTKEETDKLPEIEKKYVAFANGKYILMQPPARFVNHSCESNTHSDNFCDVAKREIKKGEEITGDYSQDETPGFEMKCNCGSKKCKKIIKKE
jgi:uncharacterized protein